MQFYGLLQWRIFAKIVARQKSTYLHLIISFKFFVFSFANTLNHRIYQNRRLLTHERREEGMNHVRLSLINLIRVQIKQLRTI